MNHNHEHLPPLFKGPEIGGTLDQRTRFSPIEFRHSFVNNTGVSITLYWRNGLQFELAPEPNPRNSTLVVRHHITVRPAGYKPMLNFLATINEQSSTELQQIREAFRSKLENNFHKGGEVVLDYSVSLRELEELGGAVYFSEIDSVIALSTVQEKIYHPYSEEGRLHDVALGAPAQKTDAGFAYFVTIIDNTGMVGPRFININRKVYQVKPKKDPRKRDGIYIVSSHSLSGTSTNGKIEKRHYPFGKEEELGLWETYEQALEGGDPSAAVKRELAEKEENIKRLNLERQEADQRNAMELARVQQETREREAVLEQERAKMEREKAEAEFREKQRRAELSDYYERRSYERKDHSEGLKFLPTLLIGLGAVAGIFLQRK